MPSNRDGDLGEVYMSGVRSPGGGGQGVCKGVWVQTRVRLTCFTILGDKISVQRECGTSESA